MKTSTDGGPVAAACEIARDGDTLAAYAAGRLPEADAEAFEQHYFACEECWELVRTASAMRIAIVTEAPAPARRRWVAVVPAAALAATIAGLALFGIPRGDAPPTPGDVFRGVEQGMSLEVVVEGSTLRTSWTPVRGAAGYELRVYDASDRLLRASAVDPQTVTVDLDMLSFESALNVVSLDVVALDGLGQVLVRSGRVPLTP
jgi:hypothetical protein